GEAQGDYLQEIEVIVATNQNDTLIGDDGDNILNGFGGQDSLVGNGGHDSLIGFDGDDLLAGGSGNDTIDGGLGNDTVSYQTTENDSGTGIVIAIDSDLINNSDGVGGIDTIRNIENVIGSPSDDRIIGGIFANSINGEQGNDFIEGKLGNDILSGGDGDDRLYGNEGLSFSTTIENNTFFTDQSAFSIGLDIDKDTLFGGAGADLLDGGTGDDELNGEAGDDILIGKVGSDTLRGGMGDDTYQLIASNHSGVVIEDLEGNDTLTLGIVSLSLSQPTDNIIGLGQDHTNLMIDINQDGVINSQNDITILDFFDDLTIFAGEGFIENIANLSGTDILNFFANDMTQI
ncbi:MAG: calcium-binding protein, partial [Microcoleaceae cyanobacterium]